MDVATTTHNDPQHPHNPTNCSQSHNQPIRFSHTVVSPFAPCRIVWCRDGVLVPISYNPQVTQSLTIPANELYLDVRTATMIYFSCILYINDSHILNLNPTYATQLNTTNEMITQNVGCGTTPSVTPVSYTLLSRMLAYQAEHPEDAELAACVNGYSAELYYDYYNCISVPEIGLFYSATETTVPPLVLGTPGAMGMMVVNGDSSYGVPTMVVERGGVNVSTTSDVDSLAACAQGTFNAAALSFDTDNPVNVTCWPWYANTCTRVLHEQQGCRTRQVSD